MTSRRRPKYYQVRKLVLPEGPEFYTKWMGFGDWNVSLQPISKLPRDLRRLLMKRKRVIVRTGYGQALEYRVWEPPHS